MNSRKPTRHQAHHREDAREHGQRQVAAEQRHRDGPAAQHQHPEQHRAFMAAPHGRRCGRRSAAPNWSSTPRTARRNRGARSASVRQTNAMPTSTKMALASGRASAIQSARPRCAPTSGTTPSTSDSAQRQPQSEMTDFRNHGCGAPPTTDLPILSFAFCGLLERFGGLGRHVVFIVLGQHFAGDEHAVLQLALGHHAFALLEQVGQDALVAHRHGLGGVGDDEAHLDAIALDRAFLHQPAEAEGAVGRRFLRRDLRRRIEEDQVALEGVEHQRGAHAHRDEHAAGDGQALVTRFHVSTPENVRARRRAKPVDGGGGRARARRPCRRP